MNVFFVVIVFALLLLGLPYLHRVVRGPTVFDRVLGLNALGTLLPVSLVFVGLCYGRMDMFVDIVLGLFLLNGVTTMLVARYVCRKGGAR